MAMGKGLRTGKPKSKHTLCEIILMGCHSGGMHATNMEAINIFLRIPLITFYCHIK